MRLCHLRTALVLLLAAPFQTSAQQSPTGSVPAPAPTVERLLRQVEGSSEDSVFATTVALSDAGVAASAVPDLIRLLGDSRGPIRVRASIALNAMKKEDLSASATDALIRALDDPEVPVRVNAVFSLRRVAPSDPRTVQALERMLLTDSQRYVRAAAADVLVESGEAGVLPALLRAVEDTATAMASGVSVAQYRGRLIRGIGEFGSAAIPGLTSLLNSPTPEIRVLAQRVLAVVRVVERRQPIINVHWHAGAVEGNRFWYNNQMIRLNAEASGGGRSIWIANQMDRYNVVLAHMSPFGDSTDYTAWHRAEPERLMMGAMFPCTDGQLSGRPCFPSTNGWPDLQWLRGEYQAGRIKVMGELNYVYYGIPPTDERLAPYWALAAELDIPVGIHIRSGVRGDEAVCCPNNNGAYSDPTLLEPILKRHPGLRIYLMHGADGPLLPKTVAFLQAHPNVYVDMSPFMGNVDDPAPYETGLRAFLDAGLADRIMLGTDGILIRNVIEATEAVSFLTEAQKRGIYYDNAARFLRVDPAGSLARAGR